VYFCDFIQTYCIYICTFPVLNKNGQQDPCCPHHSLKTSSNQEIPQCGLVKFQTCIPVKALNESVTLNMALDYEQVAQHILTQFHCLFRVFKFCHTFVLFIIYCYDVTLLPIFISPNLYLFLPTLISRLIHKVSCKQF
jgi:hypothetical protein